MWDQVAVSPLCVCVCVWGEALSVQRGDLANGAGTALVPAWVGGKESLKFLGVHVGTDRGCAASD